MARGVQTLDLKSPDSQVEAAEVLRRASDNGERVRLCGQKTKFGWGNVAEPADLELSTKRLDTIVEHNEGDLTAICEAGVRLADAQELFERAGQRLSLDPPLGDGMGATLGGVLATGDSGPLRHRYGGARDLVVGITIALSDGTLAKSGGKVIKNVAGYDLAKLFGASFGTLGLITQVSLRLHPRPTPTATLSASSPDATALAQAASALSHAKIEKECLDVRFGEGAGAVLTRFAGLTAAQQAHTATQLLDAKALETEVVTDDNALWEAQRRGQRSQGGCVVRVSGLQSDLARVVRACARHDAFLVGRAGLGLFWITLAETDPEAIVHAVSTLRAELEPAVCVVLDAPTAARERLDVWDAQRLSGLSLARQLKQRFDPAGTCNPGIFVGGI